MPRVRSASIALVALWAALLLTGGVDPGSQASTLDASPSAGTVHAPTESVALSTRGAPPSAVADVQLSGEAEGEELDGRVSTVLFSSPRPVISDERAVARGRRAPWAQSCAVLCVFLC